MILRQRTPYFTVPVERPFHFRLMILSHGWVDLEPFRWERDSSALRAVIKTPPREADGSTRAYGLRITSLGDNAPGQRLRVEIVAGGAPGGRDRDRLKAAVRWMFRLDEDFTPFQRRCRRIRGLSWVARLGLGAFLRNGDLFEEFVKVLLTTNVSWAGTRGMNANLLSHLGRPVDGGGDYRAFPGPGDIAAVSEKFLREKIKVGYRAPFLLEFARSVAAGEVRLDGFLDADEPAGTLADRLARLKGFGPYAVSALLMTLGRYDRLILDSWIRKKAAERHFKSGKATDRSIERVYAPWGSWKTLACWFECAYDTWLKDELNRMRLDTKLVE
jgi:3-methyladenine DNA glycosylase/8-oxoguanine DNA glycosylase